MRLLVEIGVEEMPAELVPEAMAELRRGVEAAIAGLAAPGAEVAVTATPRRLVAVVHDVAATEERRLTYVRGPSVERGRGPDGTWTAAATGFARARGVAPDDLVAKDGYLYAALPEGGRPAGEVLAERLPEMLAGMRFRRSMRWGVGSPRFLRPIRWIVALLDGAVVPFTFAGVTSGRESLGLRYGEPGRLVLADAAAYERDLAAAGVVVDREARRETIRSEVVARLEAGEEALLTSELLEELTDLTEAPRVLRGRFEERFLALPEAVLVTTMVHHQRFVPLRRHGRLLPAFLAVANGGEAEVVRRGNERVLRARLEDAQFFFVEDRRRSLADHLPDLEGITYLGGAGTLGERARRLASLAAAIARELGLPEAEVRHAERAALLSEADRATQMVREFPELGGVMGGIYAALSGEPEAVAAAIAEAAKPRGGGDELPSGALGRIVALAQRADHLAAGFAAGVASSGSEDPYGLRRAAIGVVRLLGVVPLRLSVLLRQAFGPFGEVPSEAPERARAFLRGRFVSLLGDEGVRAEVAEAAWSAGGDRLDEAARRARALQRLLEERPATLRRIVGAYRRAARLAAPGGKGAEGEVEEGLHRAARQIGQRVDELGASGRWEAALEALEGFVAPLETFFEHLLVMDPDPVVQARRRAILHGVVEVMRRLADFDALPATAVGEGEGT